MAEAEMPTDGGAEIQEGLTGETPTFLDSLRYARQVYEGPLAQDRAALELFRQQTLPEIPGIETQTPEQVVDFLRRFENQLTTLPEGERQDFERRWQEFKQAYASRPSAKQLSEYRNLLLNLAQLRARAEILPPGDQPEGAVNVAVPEIDQRVLNQQKILRYYSQRFSDYRRHRIAEAGPEADFDSLLPQIVNDFYNQELSNEDKLQAINSEETLERQAIERLRRGEALPTISNPGYYDEETVASRTSYGTEFPFKIWKAKIKEGESPDEYIRRDVAAKFHWALRKLEEAERIAAETYTSFEDPSVALTLQELNFAFKYFTEHPNRLYKELATKIKEEQLARQALNCYNLAFLHSGNLEQGLTAAQAIENKYFNTYFHDDQGLVENDKLPVRVGLAFYDTNFQRYLEGREESLDNFRVAAIDHIAEQWLRTEEARLNASNYQDDGTKEQRLAEIARIRSSQELKIERFRWAQAMSENTFRVTLRQASRDSAFAGDPAKPEKGNYQYRGSGVGLEYSVRRLVHFYYGTRFDPPSEEGFDGCGKDSFLNVNQRLAPNFPSLLKGIEDRLAAKDYFTYLVGALEAHYQSQLREQYEQSLPPEQAHKQSQKEGREQAMRIMLGDSAQRIIDMLDSDGKVVVRGQNGQEIEKVDWKDYQKGDNQRFSLADMQLDKINFAFKSNDFCIDYMNYEVKSKDDFRAKVMDSVEGFIRNPSYDSLAKVKDDFGHLRTQAHPTKAQFFANLEHFLRYENKSRRGRPNITLTEADSLLINGLQEGLITGYSPEAIEKFVKDIEEAMGGQLLLSLNRANNLFSIWHFMLGILQEGFRDVAKV